MKTTDKILGAILYSSLWGFIVLGVFLGAFTVADFIIPGGPALDSKTAGLGWVMAIFFSALWIVITIQTRRKKQGASGGENESR